MAFTIPTFAALGLDDPRAVGGLPSIPREDPGAAALGVLGGGLQKAGAGLFSVDAARNKLNESTATLDLFTRLSPLQTKIAQETDTGKIDEYRAELNSLLKTSGQAIDDPAVRQAWMAAHGKSIVEANSATDKRVTLLHRNKYLAGSNALIDKVIDEGVTKDDPQAFQISIAGVKRHFDALEANGVMLPEERRIAEKARTDELIRGRALNLTNRGKTAEATALLKHFGGDIDQIQRGNLEQRIEKKAETLDDERMVRGIVGGLKPGGTVPRGTSGDQVDNWETRNFNYGGLRKVGVPPAGPNAGGFQAFNSPEEGVAAISRQLDRYASGATTGKPLTTIRQIVSTWAPPSENDTPALIARASRITGFGPDQALDVSDPIVKAKLIEATIRNEQGGKLPVEAGIIAKVAGVGGVTAVNPMTSPVPGLPTREELIGRIPEGLTDERYNRVYAGVTRAYNQMMQATSADRATALSQYKGGLAMLEDGRDFPIDEGVYRRLFPTDTANEMIGNLRDAQTVGQQIVSLRAMPLQDIVTQQVAHREVLARSTGEGYAKQRRLSDAFDKAATAHLKALGDDPASYVGMNSPTVAATLAAVNDPDQPQETAPQRFADYARTSLAEQERLGVPAQGRAILSKGVAAKVVEKISALDPAKQNPGVALSGLAQSYGTYWPQVFGELVKAKLPGTYQVLATMDRPGQIAAAGDLSRAISLIAEKGGMSALKKSVQDATQKEIDQELDASLADFRESTGPQSGGPKLYATVRDAAQALSYYNAFRGQNATEATRNAVDGIINEKYDFGTIGAGQVRVPKATLGVVDQAARFVQSGINVDQLGDIPGNPLLTPAERKEVWLGAIRSGGWANNEDDSGLVLMGKFRNGTVGAVRRADGSRFEVKFDDAPGIAAKVPPDAGSQAGRLSEEVR